MTLGQDTRPERVKFIYNAQFLADTVVVLNNPHFTSRQGRRSPLSAARLILHGPLIHDLFHKRQFPQLALERYAAFTVRRAIDIGQPPYLYLDSDESALAL